jgi:hypothetical protein
VIVCRELLAETMDSRHPRVKVIPMMITGREGEVPHAFLVRLDAQARTMEWLDSCTSHPEINAEREVRLKQLRDGLHQCYPEAQWSTVDWAEWTGWEGGVPQQTNDVDCMLLAWQFALALHSGAAKVDLVPHVTLRGLAVTRLVEQGLRELRAELSRG